MRAAVLPGLTRTGTPDTDLREANRTVESLATICRLAGKTTKADQPLPMGRLGSDRAFFNLSRLEVPCRAPHGEERWEPAYRVYFGRDWAGADSVEALAEAAGNAGHDLEIAFLAPPSLFEAYAGVLDTHLDEDRGAEVGESAPDDGEVDLDDDTDQVLETDARDRWRNFFAWLGVSQGLRLVHFHDVDDTNTAWTSTKGLNRPGGWAFEHLGEIWNRYRAQLNAGIVGHPLVDTTDHYVYRVHDLDRMAELTKAARLADNNVAGLLIEHLVRNWVTYARHTQAELALVGSGKWPSSRTAPPRATPEERVTVGSDLWLFRLREQAICPTSQGPRRPDQTWRQSEEMARRFERGGKRAGDYLPVLDQPVDVPGPALRGFLDELNVRAELTPASFDIADARDLCQRISELYAGRLTEDLLRREIRPLYRELFELLVGKTGAAMSGILGDAPLAARTAKGWEFLAARDLVYASVSGSRERSGVQDKVPLFVLEAEPGALAPLRSLFATPLLEEVLEWAPNPGEAALEGEALSRFRAGLSDLVAPLLARLGADRPERAAADRKALLEFAEQVETVESLTLTCTFRGEDLGALPQRSYFVRRSSASQPFQGFISWGGQAWPPLSEDAQSLAMALADALGLNLVETFLSFINADESVRRQLLDLAGASERLDEVKRALRDESGSEGNAGPAHDRPDVPSLPPTDGSATSGSGSSPVTPPASVLPAAPVVPLRRFEDLLFEGEALRVAGSRLGVLAEDRKGGVGPFGGPGSAASPKAAAGMDLVGLDRLGMQITLAFEQYRLEGRRVVVLPGAIDPQVGDCLVVDVHSPAMIAAAETQCDIVRGVFDKLAAGGISRLFPGFDILTIVDDEVDRMIELKSSGVDAHVQAMSWNEWKTARGSGREHFWLYLIGNLRADLAHALPFVRAIRDPFGTLAASTADDVIRRRSVQLRVREFAAADELVLRLKPRADE